MAVFNPTVPDTQDPNYLSYFKPIGDIPVDKSTGQMLSGLGSILEAGTNAVDSTIKRSIDKDVYAAVDPIRDEYTTALENYGKGQSAVVVPSTTTTPGIPNTPQWNANAYGYQPASGQSPELIPTDISAQRQQNIPVQLQNGLDNIVKIGEAGAQNAGKVNDTYYTQRLTSAVKQLRAQYPGYRDYIDEKVSATTGMNPANAYIRNMMQDINTAQANAQSSKNKVESYIMSNMEVSPQMPALYQGWKQGLIPDEKIMTFINNTNSKLFQFKVDQAEREALKGNKDVDKTMATEHFTKEASFMVTNALKTYQITAGLDTAQSAADFLADVQSGKRQATQAQMEQLKTAFAGAKQTVWNQMYKRSVEPDKTGASYASRIGVSGRDEIMKSALAPYDVFQDSMSNKEYGTGTYTARMTEAYQNQATKDILENKDMGPMVRTIGALSKQMGPQVLAPMLGQLITGSMDSKIQAYVGEKLAQSWESPDIRAARGDAPRSMKADVEDAAKKGFAGKSGVYDKFLGNVNTITSNVDDETKSAVVEYMFNPRNTGSLDNFNMEYRDPQTGQTVPGKMAAFNILTNPQVTQEIARLSNTKPELWNNYQRWTELSFAKLYGEQVRNLNEIQNKAGIDFHVAWDSDKKQFELLGPKGERLTQENISKIQWASKKNLLNPAVDGYVRSALQEVGYINRGLITLSGVQDYKNIDTQSYLMRVLSDNGYMPRSDTKGLTENPQSLPLNMFKALQQQEEDATRPKRPEDLDLMKRRSTRSTSVSAG